MPSINLRLSEQQHAELEVWAKDGHRSLQKEIIWRLFANEGATITGERLTASGGTDVTAAADSAQTRRERSREPTKSGATPPDDDALRPPRSSCPMQPPRGTKCKVCGKVHPL